MSQHWDSIDYHLCDAPDCLTQEQAAQFIDVMHATVNHPTKPQDDPGEGAVYMNEIRLEFNGGDGAFAEQYGLNMNPDTNSRLVSIDDGETVKFEHPRHDPDDRRPGWQDICSGDGPTRREPCQSSHPIVDNLDEEFWGGDGPGSKFRDV